MAATQVEWPAEGLEPVPACPLCGDERRSLLYDGLTDRLWFTAPGRWSLHRCLACGSAFLDPRPTRRYRATQQRIAAERDAFLWPRVVEQLADELPPARYPPRAAASLAEYGWSALAGTVRRRGIRGTAREIADVLRRPDVP